MTLNNLQMLLDNLNLPLAVGPINDEDYQVLISGYSELEWEHGFSCYGNRGDKFEFCVKLLSGPLKNLPAGAALCTYDQTNSVLEIHFIESFVKDKLDHPLYGRMFLVTLWAAYLFGTAAGCDEVKINEPINEKVVQHYKKFGFEGDMNVLSAPFANITDVLKRYAINNK